MLRLLGLAVCAAILITVAPDPAAAQGGIISGRVTDSTGAPLGRASVSVDGTRFGALTSDL
ncbi:MAG: hypothetical protein ACRDHF_11445, partial [Tepidiformaceae bacterium]